MSNLQMGNSHNDIENKPEESLCKKRFGLKLMEAIVAMDSSLLHSMTNNERMIFLEAKHSFKFDKDGSLIFNKSKDETVVHKTFYLKWSFFLI